MQISLQLKDSACKPQKAIEWTKLKGDMAPTKEVSYETMEKIGKLIQKGKVVHNGMRWKILVVSSQLYLRFGR